MLFIPKLLMCYIAYQRHIQQSKTIKVKWQHLVRCIASEQHNVNVQDTALIFKTHFCQET